ncbi:MAG: hypothetical protein JNJ49_12370 [Bdellovibrionaceae bacterium]|nr:hypothetical protein [Pseudobdellovibrionaceae bacterium]
MINKTVYSLIILASCLIGIESFGQQVTLRGGSLGDYGYCVERLGKADFVGCYETPEFKMDVYDFRTHELEKETTAYILSRLEKNDQTTDSLGVGYCTSDKHPYHISQDIVFDDGRRGWSQESYPDYYINSLELNKKLTVYVWDSEMATCSPTGYTLTWTSKKSYKLESTTKKPIDFENILYKPKVKALEYSKAQ